MYQVVFTGRLLKGADRATVETELQRLFKAKPAQVEWFLRGKPIVVKSTADAALASRYHDALIKAGLECELRGEQPSSASMAPPPEVSPASGPQRQLPIPGVSPRPARLATPPPAAPAQRRAPTLGPVTQAITAQDQAPAFVAAAKSEKAPVATATPGPVRSVRPRVGLSRVFLLPGAVLLGVLVYGLAQPWKTNPPARTAVSISTALPGTSVDESQDSETDSASAQAQTPEALIVGRWQCVEAASGRVVENEFSADGRYRSLAHGRDDAFQQIDQMDVLVEGRYWLEGDRVVLHVQQIPSRELFGGSARADDYLYWQIESLTPEVMVWADLQLQEVSESCLRSQGLPPGPSERVPGAP
jgi:hypothetical protein